MANLPVSAFRCEKRELPDFFTPELIGAKRSRDVTV
jgi:hypothetical protein